MSDLKMAREALPETLRGHWETSDGLEKAREYAAKSRADLAMSDRTDLGLANALYLADGYLPIQTAAKERMRWLSVQLALVTAERDRLSASEAPPASPSPGAWAEVHSKRLIALLSRLSNEAPSDIHEEAIALLSTLNATPPAEPDVMAMQAESLTRLNATLSRSEAGAPSREAIALLIAGWRAHPVDLGPDNEVIGDRVAHDRGQGLGEVPALLGRLADAIRALYASPPAPAGLEREDIARIIQRVKAERVDARGAAWVGEWSYEAADQILALLSHPEVAEMPGRESDRG